MNLKQLPYIIAIANTGNLSAAAKQLRVSQPALSKYLNALTQEFGLDFFTKRDNRLYPTAAGQAYLDAAYKILDIQSQGLSSIQALHGHKRDTVRIGVTPHRGANQAAYFYPVFVKMFPQCDLVLKEGYANQFFDFLLNRDIDLALSSYVRNGPLSPDYAFIPLFEEDVLLAAPRFTKIAQYAAKDGEPFPVISLQECQDLPFIMMTRDTTIGRLGRQLCRDSGFSPIVVYESPNVMMVNSMIRSGTGVGFIPAFYATPSEDVVYFRLDTPLTFCICIVTQKGHTLSLMERGVVYLMTVSSMSIPSYRFCPSPLLEEIMQEFKDTPAALAFSGKDYIQNGYQNLRIYH